jgi:hypothetical protein
MTRRGVATVAVLALLAGACTLRVTTGPSPPPKTGSPSPVPSGRGSAAAARRVLCDVPSQTPPPEGTPEEGTPPQIAEVEHEVSQERGLSYSSPVPVQGLTPAQMANAVGKAFDQTVPTELYARRSRAWSTIGVIPPGDSIRNDLHAFQTSQVLGFYVPETGRLVYVGRGPLSPLSHVILAHELTHAVDDQHFNLDRVDRLVTTCADEQEQAALGAVEGSAQFFSFEVARDFLTPQELAQVGAESGNAPAPDVPPFIEQTQLWPYSAGLSFISAVNDSGGTAAVNAALQNLPVSTEQIMHPERYPNDVPVPVDIPDLSPKLGGGWTTIDVSDVGEEFLNIMIGLRLDRSRADEAAAGWGGGIYRAWANGSHVAVEMSTVWDTSQDAQQFATTMSDWLDAGSQAAVVLPTRGTSVRVLFGSDPLALGAIERVVG